MTALGQHVADYLAIRQALGFKLHIERRMLADFVAFMASVGQSTVTVDVALRWATMPTGVVHAYRAQRMRAVRGFARYLHGIDPATEIPPLELLPARRHRPTPHIYTEQQIAALMVAARTLRLALRAATIETAIGLLACTGLRVGEVFALDRADIDAPNRLLRIRDSKYGKSREVLIHDSTLAALHAYLARRDELRPTSDRVCVFVSSWGARLNHKAMQPAFDRVRRAADVAGSSPGRWPRAHDLRHTFAVNTLLGWYRAGEDVAAKLPLLSTYLGHVDPAATYWYLSAVPELLGLAAERLERKADGRDTRDLTFLLCAGKRATRAGGAHTEGRAMSALAPTMQAFFTERLIGQRQASPHTIAAYRDTFRLLLAFAQQRTGIEPHALDIDDLDSALVTAFLDHLERDRGNNPRTRNARLAAVRSLYRYAALRHPEHAATIARVLAIPTKRHDRAIVCYLDEPETAALLAAPDQTSWIGRRDHALMTLTVQTGLRVSELIALRCLDAHLAGGPHIQATGKGRKQRITPLTTHTADVVRRWTKERAGGPDQPLFPTSRGHALSRDAVALLVGRHAKFASRSCPTLATKTVSPHVLRHTAAMNLLRAGIDTSVIALWLGHESTEATQIYLHADIAIKERALARTTPIAVKPGRYRPADALLAFLEAL